MTYSSKCEGLVRKFEGLRLIAYRCPAGVRTIGFGHTSGVHQGDIIDSLRADTLLTGDLDYVANVLSSMLPTTLAVSQGQFDALCSLCFNLAGGPRALPHKAPRLWAALMAGDAAGAAHEFLDMDHALVNGKPVELPGLKARREAEAAMFLQAA